MYIFIPKWKQNGYRSQSARNLPYYEFSRQSLSPIEYIYYYYYDCYYDVVVNGNGDNILHLRLDHNLFMNTYILYTIETRKRERERETFIETFAFIKYTFTYSPIHSIQWTKFSWTKTFNMHAYSSTFYMLSSNSHGKIRCLNKISIQLYDGILVFRFSLAFQIHSIHAIATN